MFSSVASFSAAMQIATSPAWGGIDMDAALANADAINELDMLWVGCGTEDGLFNVNKLFSTPRGQSPKDCRKSDQCDHPMDGAVIRPAGHTGARATESYNATLSTARAEAVREALIRCAAHRPSAATRWRSTRAAGRARPNPLAQQSSCGCVHVSLRPIQYFEISDTRRSTVGRCRLSVGDISRIRPDGKWTFLG